MFIFKICRPQADDDDDGEYLRAIIVIYFPKGLSPCDPRDQARYLPFYSAMYSGAISDVLLSWPQIMGFISDPKSA